ncbi:MAG: hypothetical protein GXP49_07290 [Deltaproteobacteria bacterium]|nr:hypothetical protein [Deltaproteobacteria bacterium]
MSKVSCLAVLSLSIIPLQTGCGRQDGSSSPPKPFFEKGLVAPEQSIPCYYDDTGKQADSCNHHGSSVAIEKDGTVLVAWYTGVSEKSRDSSIVWARKPPGETEFEKPEVLFDEPHLAEGNPVIWVREDGDLFLFFVTIFGESWNDARVRMIRSKDRGETWSKVVDLREEWRWMTRNHPLRMSSGELLLPCYNEREYIPAFLVSSNDFEKDWKEITMDMNNLIPFLQQIQPTVIRKKDGSLLALNRNETSLGGDNRRATMMSSLDNGRTWSDPELSEVPNSGVGIEMITLEDGNVVLAFDNSPNRRFPVAAALSEDEGRTWSHVAVLNDECPEGKRCGYGYTSIAQNPRDKSLWVSYTYNRDTIGWIHFNEEWLKQQDDGFNYQDN